MKSFSLQTGSHASMMFTEGLFGNWEEKKMREAARAKLNRLLAKMETGRRHQKEGSSRAAA